ncbi:MAG: TetR/AcrR family transcriptional regulator [Deltaproteobacteria bacterium]|jgi:TetR/AcrR family transcriptional regulator of autoinduction and epiphytic fitness|nr:TetR/AcrR family transcriptional regulator [Deltaproteobacteria bacterium]
MKTQKKSRAAIKRDSILEAAIRAFRDVGYECTSMDRIAELAGASKRTVYNHFGSKEALFEAVVARLFEAAAALKNVEWDPERPLEAQLADFARAKTMIAEDDASRCLARVVLGVFIRQPELINEVLVRSTENENALVIWLEKADAAGRLSVPNPELAASMFWAMASGALFWPQLLKGPLDPEERSLIMGEVVETFLARYRSASA